MMIIKNAHYNIFLIYIQTFFIESTFFFKCQKDQLQSIKKIVQNLALRYQNPIKLQTLGLNQSPFTNIYTTSHRQTPS